MLRALRRGFDGRHAYVHFAGLPALCFDVAADPHWTVRSGARRRSGIGAVLDQAQAMLSWRMLTAERRLTGARLRRAGVVGRYDRAPVA